MACSTPAPVPPAWRDRPIRAAPGIAIRLPASFAETSPDSFAETTASQPSTLWVHVTILTPQAIDSFFSPRTAYIEDVPIRVAPGRRSWCRLTLAGSDAYAGYSDRGDFAGRAYSLVAYAPLGPDKVLRLEAFSRDSLGGLQLLAIMRSLHHRG